MGTPPREIDVELHEAISKAAPGAGGARVISDLLSRKADPDSPDADGHVPLALAVRRDAAAQCRLLLVYQADPGPALRGAAPARSESADLVRAWARAEVPAVLSLLEVVAFEAAFAHDAPLLGLALSGLDVAGGSAEGCAAQLDGSRNSLLHHCASGVGQVLGAGGEAAARLTARALLGWGAPADARNARDETPLLLAVRRIGALARCGAPAVPLEPARALLEARADAEAADPQTQETLLMLAAREGNLAACELLLRFGADPLRQNAEGRTAINHCADRPEVVLLLRTSLVRGASAELDRRAASNAAAAEPSPPARGPSKADDSGTSPGAGAERPLAVGFMLNDARELNSAEGLLNQVDLEESYDADWSDALPHGPPRG